MESLYKPSESFTTLPNHVQAIGNLIRAGEGNVCDPDFRSEVGTITHEYIVGEATQHAQNVINSLMVSAMVGQESIDPEQERQSSKLWVDCEIDSAFKLVHAEQLGEAQGPVDVRDKYSCTKRLLGVLVAEQVLEGVNDGSFLPRGDILRALPYVYSYGSVQLSHPAEGYKSLEARRRKIPHPDNLAERVAHDVMAIQDFGLYLGFSKSASGESTDTQKRMTAEIVRLHQVGDFADKALRTGVPDKYFRMARRLANPNIFDFRSARRSVIGAIGEIGYNEYHQLLEQAAQEVNDIKRIVASRQSPVTYQILGERCIVQERLAEQVHDLVRHVATEAWANAFSGAAIIEIDYDVNAKRLSDELARDPKYQEAREALGKAEEEFYVKVGCYPRQIFERFSQGVVRKPDGETIREGYRLDIEGESGSEFGNSIIEARTENQPGDNRRNENLIDVGPPFDAFQNGGIYVNGQKVIKKSEAKRIAALFPLVGPSVDLPRAEYEPLTDEQLDKLVRQLLDATEKTISVIPFWESSNAAEIIQEERRWVGTITAA